MRSLSTGVVVVTGIGGHLGRAWQGRVTVLRQMSGGPAGRGGGGGGREGSEAKQMQIADSKMQDAGCRMM
jgi:hypothetical protein